MFRFPLSEGSRFYAEYDSSFAGALQSDSCFSGKISSAVSALLWIPLIFLGPGGAFLCASPLTGAGKACKLQSTSNN
jgi:hypothetical protein